MVDEVGIARVIQRGGELRGQADAVIELPQRQQAGVGGERRVGYLDLNRQRPEEIQVEQRSSL